jgi:hypothetical protein
MNTVLKPPVESAGWLATFHDMTTEDLKSELADSLALTAKSLLRSACLVHVLEGRGEDLAGLRIGILKWLKLIAHGLLLPEAVVRYAGKRSVLDNLCKLPVEEQRRLLEGGTLRLVVYGDDGKRTHRMVPLTELEEEPKLFRQAFDRNGYRSEAGQHLFLDGENKKRAAPVAESIGPARLDREAKCAWVGKKQLSLADLKRIVRALEG